MGFRNYLEKMALRYTALGQRYRAVCAENEVLSREIEDLEARNKRFQTLALTDDLTGLPNRRYFDSELISLFERAKRSNTRLSLAMLDLDNFKGVNDTYGHSVGDAVLRETARRIRKRVRKSDFAARYGGEEFAIILFAADKDDSRRAMGEFNHEISGTPYQISVNGTAYRLAMTASIGAATYYPDFVQMNASDLVAYADQELYRAKKEGRNRVCVLGL